MIPDNETFLDAYEAEQLRKERRQRKREIEEEMEPEIALKEIPFYEED